MNHHPITWEQVWWIVGTACLVFVFLSTLTYWYEYSTKVVCSREPSSKMIRENGGQFGWTGEAVFCGDQIYYLKP